MKIISFILSTTMLIQSVVPTRVYAAPNTDNFTLAEGIGLRSPYIGTGNFKELVEKSDIYVDKSLFIKDIIEAKKKVILITRPRRWGKTINMSMLKYFFNREVDNKGTPLEVNPNKWMFERSKIGPETTTLVDVKLGKRSAVSVVGHFQGKYPTILLSLKDVKKNTYDEMKTAIEGQIIDLYAQYKYLPSISKWMEESSSHGDETKFKDKIKERIVNSISLEKSLKTLSEWLYNYHGEKTYILIDEYDTPLNNAYVKGYFDKGADLIRSLFGSAFKDNSYLEKGILTGILRIAKADLFSGLNNFVEDSVLSSQYSQYYGFTENEVTDLLSIYGVKNQDAVKGWYNGYTIGTETIYNPWSVANYLSNLGQENSLQPYWLKTETGVSDMINKQMLTDESEVMTQTLLSSDGVIHIPINNNLSVLDIKNSPHSLWTLLVYAGYLTCKNITSDMDANFSCTARIPNKEVRSFFKEYNLDWFKGRASKVLAKETGLTLPLINYLLDHIYAIWTPDVATTKLPDTQKMLNAIEAFYKSPSEEKELARQKIIGLDQTYRTQMLVQGIVRQDKSALSELFGSSGFACEDSALPLNIFHLSAMVRDHKILELLAQYCSDKAALLSQEDKAGLGLAPIDYAILANNKEAYNWLKKAGSKETLEKPSWIGELICYDATKALAVSAATVIGTWELIAKKSWKGVLTAVGLGVAPDVIKRLFLSGFCDHRYMKADISNPQKFDTPNQLEKYIVYNQDNFLQLQTPCDHRRNATALVEVPTFKSTLEKYLTLQVCHLPDNISRDVSVPLSWGKYIENIVGAGVLVAIPLFLIRRSILLRALDHDTAQQPLLGGVSENRRNFR